MVYRADGQGLARERERLAQRIAELEQRWTETFWREVAPRRGVAKPGSEKPARDLEKEVAKLAARLDALNELERDAPRLVDEWESAPPLPEPQFPELRGPGTEPLARFCAAVRHAVGDLPIGAQGRCERTQMGSQLVGYVVTTTAPGTGRLSVRGEGFFDEVRKLFGSKHDIQLGHERFDGIFAVEGDEAAARALLDVETRAALLRMGERSAVVVRSGGGRAYIGDCGLWDGGGPPDIGWIRSAVTVARALHRMPAPPLRR